MPNQRDDPDIPFGFPSAYIHRRIVMDEDENEFLMGPPNEDDEEDDEEEDDDEEEEEVLEPMHQVSEIIEVKLQALVESERNPNSHASFGGASNRERDRGTLFLVNWACDCCKEGQRSVEESWLDMATLVNDYRQDLRMLKDLEARNLKNLK